MKTTVTIPHAGRGTHTLLVAVEIDDRMLGRPDLHQQLLGRISKLVTEALAPHQDDRRQAIAACEGLDADPARILSTHRDQQTAHARQELCRRLHDEHGWSLSRIGRCLGRDHTTVLHGVRQARQRLVCDTDGCDEKSLAGGRWCLRHYQEHVDQRRKSDLRRQNRSAA